MNTLPAVDAYIKSAPTAAQKQLRTIRAIIRTEAPEAVEVMSYGMPAYKFSGMLVYFAAHTQHVGLYPMRSGVLHFKKELASYKTAAGSIQFPFSKPLPTALVRKIVQFRVKENLQKSKRAVATKAAVTTSEFPKMSAPAQRALTNARIMTLNQLSKKTEKEIAALHGMGPSTLPGLRAALKARGLSFKSELKNKK